MEEVVINSVKVVVILSKLRIVIRLFIYLCNVVYFKKYLLFIYYIFSYWLDIVDKNESRV